MADDQRLDTSSAALAAHNAAGITRWVEDTLGATVTRIEQQRRWRPVWRVFISKDGKESSLLFKSDRAWPAHPYPLRHEWEILQVLAANGMLIPTLHGLCPDPEAIVMEWVTGGRSPGMVMESEDDRSVMTPDRWAASLSYMEMLAHMHNIDAKAFQAVGLEMPEGPRDTALNTFDRFHAMCQEQNVVDPMMEFCKCWLERNVPPLPAMVSFVTGDCGQFLSDGPVVTAVIDFEVGHLGDYHHDLACFRGRHPIENMGDLPALYRHYEKALGKPVDFHRIAYQTIVFMCIGYYAPLFALNNKFPGGDWVEAVVQVAMIGRRCMEALAEIVGVPLEEFDLPAPRVTPMEDMALRKLGDEIRRIPPTEEFAAWQRLILGQIPDYLLSQQHYSAWAEQQDLAELEPILGHRPSNLVEADRALAEYVRTVGAEKDRELIVLFYRRMLRQCLIIANGKKDHLVLVKMEPIL